MNEHRAFLEYVAQYVEKSPEVAGHVADYVTDGVIKAHNKTLQRAADMETALAVAVAKRYSGRDELILSKLKKWKHCSALNWDGTIEMLERVKEQK